MAEALRDLLEERYKAAGSTNNTCAAGTLRLILAAIRERDYGAGENGDAQISDAEIVQLLRDMVSQRREEIERCECTARIERAAREADEVEVILDLLPKPLTDDETRMAVGQVIEDTHASSLKDTGRVVAALKSRYPGRLNIAAAKRLISQRLA